MNTSKADLAMTIDESEWSWLRSHLERGGLILVDESLDLAVAALKVAEDDINTIEYWVSSGKFSKPSEKQILAWAEAHHARTGACEHWGRSPVQAGTWRRPANCTPPSSLHRTGRWSHPAFAR